MIYFDSIANALVHKINNGMLMYITVIDFVSSLIEGKRQSEAHLARDRGQSVTEPTSRSHSCTDPFLRRGYSRNETHNSVHFVKMIGSSND